MQEHQFGSRAAQLSLWKHFQFELRGAVGHLLSARRRRPRAALLQIGSGLNPLAGFENLDFHFAHRGRARHVGHDVRRALPYADASFDGAYSEHTLEHMYPAEAISLIAEVARVLRAGAIFRCSVPDLARYVAFYEGRPSPEPFAMFASGCEAMWNLTQNHLHRSVWDAEMLTRQMLDHGFAQAQVCAFGEGADPRLLVDQPHRAWESLYVEGRR